MIKKRTQQQSYLMLERMLPPAPIESLELVLLVVQ